MATSRKAIWIFSIAAIVTIGALTLTSGAAAAATHVVNQTSPACAVGDYYYTSIQAAVWNANDGDTIIVCPGRYNETVNVNKNNIVIKAFNETKPVVSANGASDHVFDISHQRNVTLEGFEIRDANGTDRHVAGIYMIDASECSISNNSVTNISAIGFNFAYGIYLWSSSNNTFSGHTNVSYVNASHGTYGIMLATSSNNSFNASISVSNISANETAYGIMFYQSNNNSFDELNISNIKALGTAFAADFLDSPGNTVDNLHVSDITGNPVYGVVLGRSSYNTFNELSVNRTSSPSDFASGFDMYDSTDNLLRSIQLNSIESGGGPAFNELSVNRASSPSDSASGFDMYDSTDNLLRSIQLNAIESGNGPSFMTSIAFSSYNSDNNEFSNLNIQDVRTSGTGNIAKGARDSYSTGNKYGNVVVKGVSSPDGDAHGFEEYSSSYTTVGKMDISYIDGFNAFGVWLCVANPSNFEEDVHVTYMTADGSGGITNGFRIENSKDVKFSGTISVDNVQATGDNCEATGTWIENSTGVTFNEAFSVYNLHATDPYSKATGFFVINSDIITAGRGMFIDQVGAEGHDCDASGFSLDYTTAVRFYETIDVNNVQATGDNCEATGWTIWNCADIEAASVSLTYMIANGSGGFTKVIAITNSKGVTFRDTISGNNVHATGDNSKATALSVKNSDNVIAERPMYFNYVSASGHDSDARGIYADPSDNITFNDTLVSNITASGENSRAYGIYLLSATNHTFRGHTNVSFVTATDDAYGIVLNTSDNNTFNSGPSIIDTVTSANGTAYGICLLNNTDDNNFSGITILPTLTGGTGHYEFWSEEGCDDNVITDMTIGNPTTISFTYGDGVSIKRVEAVERPADPPGYKNIGKYINASNLSPDSWLFVNFSYSQVDVTGVDEGTLKVWKYNGTWYEEGWNGERVLDTANNVVGVNITSFSIFAPLVGNPVIPPAITSFAPPSPVNDTVCTWRTFNVTVNQTVNVSWYLNDSLVFTNESVMEASYRLHAEVAGEHNVSAIATNANGTAMQTWIWNVVSEAVVFDTDSPANPYPSICGVHNGTITPNQTMIVQKLYTYPCAGSSGHTEYAAISYPNGTVLAVAQWKGYKGDWHNITFNNSFTLYANETYNYTIRTGSYPQIIHATSYNATGGVITCTEFVDINGIVHYDWIPAIRLS
jgi:nitrous oxidase accessory protein